MMKTLLQIIFQNKNFNLNWELKAAPLASYTSMQNHYTIQIKVPGNENTTERDKKKFLPGSPAMCTNCYPNHKKIHSNSPILETGFKFWSSQEFFLIIILLIYSCSCYVCKCSLHSNIIYRFKCHVLNTNGKFQNVKHVSTFMVIHHCPIQINIKSFP
jgi:hypothetical protein